MTPERVLAALALATCIVMLLRLAIGARRRQRLDAVARRVASAVVRFTASARHRRDAAREANEVIERARKRTGEWDGNVYRPRSFRKPPRDKMH